MKRLVIITVGKTHSGKTTFARALEEKLHDSVVMDQDNHAAFINTYYKTLQPKQGPNTLKHALSKLIVDYTVEHTNFHLIICNSNRSVKDRSYLLEELFPEEDFTRILVHFDIPDDVLQARVEQSNRSTSIFRGAKSFEEVLIRQHANTFRNDVIDPKEGEADHLLVVRDSVEVETAIERIVRIAES
ncbi:AAA domain-containing protein [Oceanobacillus limi]|uniref:AAA domain-containing protein n=1 Tax=Oceanobacillus limi TaxID=930131 RepID=A0A1I0GJ28_9BACI|nr:ATP-binding protein [Oceanobacillus limi]SET71195.1 AAA domain-containing protein [Oceanobacillus limi]